MELYCFFLSCATVPLYTHDTYTYYLINFYAPNENIFFALRQYLQNMFFSESMFGVHPWRIASVTICRFTSGVNRAFSRPRKRQISMLALQSLSSHKGPKNVVNNSCALHEDSLVLPSLKPRWPLQHDGWTTCSLET